MDKEMAICKTRNEESRNGMEEWNEECENTEF